MEISMLRADIHEDREATMARFLSGVRSEISDQLELQYYTELEDMVEKAIKIERRLKRRGTTRNYASIYTSNQRNFQPWRDDTAVGNPTTSWPKQEVSINPRPNVSKFDSRGASKPVNETSRPRN
ncbi:uncharacterized protein LOC113780382 [Coffea eugenioides]|uniref:uncharacterized protein LOC113780382 n=1 Tax=Coffea eugenioides TaxID=49369 RepID=UPI000F60AF27|nr:uncharacterized protein LOC113780382 [Coffea eugenioides]